MNSHKPINTFSTQPARSANCFHNSPNNANSTSTIKGLQLWPRSYGFPRRQSFFLQMDLLLPNDLVFQLTEGPFGCPHAVAQNPHNTWFALGGSSSPLHLLLSTNTHNNTAVILSLFMCLKDIPDFGTTILSYHQPFCLISCCGQGHCWNILTSLPLSVDSLCLLFCFLQILTLLPLCQEL